MMTLLKPLFFVGLVAMLMPHEPNLGIAPKGSVAQFATFHDTIAARVADLKSELAEAKAARHDTFKLPN